jgi:DNA replication and repair protein RecF
VRFEWLRLENLRNLPAAELEFGTGINLITGGNGAGKTSILEAAYLLSHAQSFRAHADEVLIRRGTPGMAIAAHVVRAAGPIRLGLGRDATGWQPRINGAPAPSLGALLRECALVCFEPGSHALISGGGGGRRRFLDWGVFHVEPMFLGKARHYQRALRQRNIALKQGCTEAELAAWDAELTAAGEPLARMRADYFAVFADELNRVLRLFLPELGAGVANLSSGWPEEADLAEVLAARRAVDRARGHTTRGPHRADWSVHFEQAPMKEHLSRGQEKLCALACVLAQARVHAAKTGDWPVIALDDLASELDAEHQAAVLEMLCGAAAQVLISGIEAPAMLHDIQGSIHMFHVEHGRVRALL